jgi:hypothetical protein
MAQSVFLLYCKDDETNSKLGGLIRDIKHNQDLFITQKNDFQLDGKTKKIIFECDIFICCLSKKFSESKLIDIVKFTHYIARKRIDTIYLENQKERFLAKVEDQSFFRFKTVEYSSFDQIEKVNIIYNI